MFLEKIQYFFKSISINIIKYPTKIVNFLKFLGRAECPRCKKLYKNRQSLSCHIRKDCGKGKPFSCSICSKKFTRKYNLKMHLTLMHKVEKL